jgi:hypothetical protein
MKRLYKVRASRRAYGDYYYTFASSFNEARDRVLEYIEKQEQSRSMFDEDGSLNLGEKPPVIAREFEISYDNIIPDVRFSGNWYTVLVNGNYARYIVKAHDEDDAAEQVVTYVKGILVQQQAKHQAASTSDDFGTEPAKPLPEVYVSKLSILEFPIV